MKGEFPYLIIEQNKNNNDNQEEESDFSDKKYKKMKLNKFEKFKPKNINSPKKNQNLKGAEINVKSLISVFLKDIEQENFSPQNNKDKKDKTNLHKISNKDNLAKKFKRSNLKRNSISQTNTTFAHNSFNRLNFGTNNNLYFNRNNVNNLRGINNNKEGSVVFNVTTNQKNLGVGNSNNKIKYSSNSIINSNRGSDISSIKKSNKKNQISSDLNESLENIKIKEVKTKKKTSLKRMKTFNFGKSKMGTMLAVNPNLKNNLYIKKNSNITDKNIIHSLLQKKDSLLYNLNINDTTKLNDNNYGSSQYSTVFQKKKSKKFKNSNKKNINSIFNESVVYNNSIISEGSECNLNQKSIEEINKISSSTVNQKMTSLLCKKTPLENTNVNNKEPILQNQRKLNRNSQSEIRGFKRSTTNYFDLDKKAKFQRKIKRRNTQLKSIKKQLKNSLIIRPEDMEGKFGDNKFKSKKKVNNSSSSLRKVKINNNNNNNNSNNNKSKSGTSLFKVKANNLNLENLNKTELSRKNRSCINNIIVPIPKIKTEKIIKNEIKVKETEEKDEPKEIASKEDSSDNMASNSVKRYNALFNKKYRRLVQKGILYDSLDDEEFEDFDEVNSIYLHPNSKFILIFDSMLIISGFLSFIISPFYLAQTHDFCREKYFTFIDITNIIIESLNIIDVFLSFFRGYYNWEEQLIHRNKTIIKNYLSGWFLFDLIAAVPIYNLSKLREPYCNDFELSTTYYNIILDNPHYLLISNRLFKLYKIFSFNHVWKVLSNKNDSISMIIYTFTILFSLNYVACLYIFIARNNYPNWILNSQLGTSSFYDIYICSIYILIMAITSVGYGDITCYCFWEIIFQLFLLIVGIMAYSWAVSSFSNYVQKINEKSADYEKKKSILDEIKLNNPNLPEELYEKILRFLKFKNFHEKELKNIIFDCLPVSLKNSLICEMYKPIIKNFIFFKNFQNTDFIVRVILVFKPVIAYKNDILINDNDMVEDIMFVKKGVLSVELPINMTNPQENVDKYLNMPILKSENNNEGGTGNTTLLVNNTGTKNNKFKNTLCSFLDKNKNNPIFKNSTIGFNSTVLGSFGTHTFGTRQTLSESEKEKEKIIIRYIRILCIRENEHFGDVMMFLEQRSPLRVRVKSKKSELFFLKKMDAIKISTSYPNIWRRINKKSVFNFEQIKKSINKIIEIYCSVKKLNSINEESSDIYDDITKGSKIGNRESVIDIRPKNFDSGIENIKKSNELKKSQSFNNSTNKLIKRLIIKESHDNNIDSVSNINIKRKISLSCKKITNNLRLALNNNYKKSNLNSSSLSSSSDNKKSKRKKKSNKKLINAFKGNYKYYKNMDGKGISKNNIIKEEPGKEDTLHPMKPVISFKNIQRYSVSLPKNFISNKINDMNKNINSINKNKKQSHGNLINNLSNIKKMQYRMSRNNISFKNLKFDDSSTIKLFNDYKDNLIENSEENSMSYDEIINDEIYSGEEIKISKEENLLFKKIDISNSLKKISHINELSNIIEHKNSKLQMLLSSELKNDSSKLKSKENISEYNVKNEQNNLLDSSNKNIDMKRKWENKCFIINNHFSIEYESAYENSNNICNGKLIKSKINQDKLKEFLINNILNSNLSNNNSIVELTHNKTINSNRLSRIKYKEKRKSAVFSNSPKFFSKHGNKYFEKCSSLLSNSRTLNTNNNTNPTTSNNIKRTSSLNEIIVQKNKVIKSNFQSDLNDYNNNSHLSGRKMNKGPRKKLISTKAALFTGGFNGLISSPLESKKKGLNKMSSLMSPFSRPKKKKDNLLSKINFNIQKTNQNLNNPDLFYSNYFNSLLEGDKSMNPLFGASMKNVPRMKKDKNNLLLKNFTRKNSK